MFCGIRKGSYTLGRRTVIVAQAVKYDEQILNTIVKHPKTLEDESLIAKALKENEFLNNLLQGKQIQNVIDTMYSTDVSEGEIVIQEGENGWHMFISASGSFDIIVKDKVVGSFKDIRVFGELAILYNSRRLATIRSKSEGRLWVLDCHIFKQQFIRNQIEEQQELVSFLQNVPTLNTVSVDILSQVASLLKPEFFPTGEDIVKEGEKGEKFYIVRAGSVSVHKIEGGKVGQLNKGEFFGELALLKEEFRQATVTADAPGVECLSLSRQHFINHFGEVREFVNIKQNVVNEPVDETQEYQDLKWEDLKILTTLGIGGFGRVELVQHTSNTDLVFALKYMKKTEIVKNKQQDHVRNEKTIQLSCHNQFIVRLYRTYSDPKYIYFLQEACLGGELFTLMFKQKKRCFDENSTKFYAACVFEALSYLHERGIVYRDLKPENVVLDATGYPKLTDFGFAKKLPPGEKTYTFLGTPEYVAPELILGKGYDKSLDIWTLGIFIYELLCGKTPFKVHHNHIKTYKSILKGIDYAKFPSSFSSNSKQIIKSLCRANPVDRLGCQKNGFIDIKNHQWLAGFDWYSLRERKLKPPLNPKLKCNTDTRHFVEYGKEHKDLPPDELTGWDEGF